MDYLNRYFAPVNGVLEPPGAVGLSSGPDYLPSRSGSAEEVADIARPLAAAGRAYVSHLRAYGPDVRVGLDGQWQAPTSRAATALHPAGTFRQSRGFPARPSAERSPCPAGINGTAVRIPAAPCAGGLSDHGEIGEAGQADDEAVDAERGEGSGAQVAEQEPDRGVGADA